MNVGLANVLCACSYATSGAPLKIQFNVGSDCRLVFLEHVVVQMSLSITVKYGSYYSYDDYYNDPYVVYHDGPRRGNIFLEMYSPHGTRSVVTLHMCDVSCHVLLYKIYSSS